MVAVTDPERGLLEEPRIHQEPKGTPISSGTVHRTGIGQQASLSLHQVAGRGSQGSTALHAPAAVSPGPRLADGAHFNPSGQSEPPFETPSQFGKFRTIFPMQIHMYLRRMWVEGEDPGSKEVLKRTSTTALLSCR